MSFGYEKKCAHTVLLAVGFSAESRTDIVLLGNYVNVETTAKVK